MQLPLIPLALIALAVQGCLSHAVHPPEIWPRTVYIWNGEKCVETLRNEKQLSKLENLSAFVRRNGRIESLELYAENVSPTAVDDLWTRGGVIDLPNGEKVKYPPGSKSSQGDVLALIQAEIEKTRTLGNHNIEYSGPLPEITSAN